MDRGAPQRSGSTVMGPWQTWIAANEQKLAHPAGFEEQFVRLVLSKIAIIDPSDVIPQYEFTDDSGKRRRIDFMIKNEERGYLLPVELDGFDKDKESGQWNDFLARQNALVQSFGFVLRYSNAQMFNNKDFVVSEITKFLSIQSSRKYAEAYTKTAIESVATNAVAGFKTLETIAALGKASPIRQASAPQRPSSRSGRPPRQRVVQSPAAAGRSGLPASAAIIAGLLVFMAGFLSNPYGPGIAVVIDDATSWASTTLAAVRSR